MQGWTFDSSRPIYIQISNEIVRRISTGIYAAGEKLPSVREFALEAGVNPNTMARALSELERLGLIVTERASGKYVTTNTEVLLGLRKELINQVLSHAISELENLGLSREQIIDALHNYANERSV